MENEKQGTARNKTQTTRYRVTTLTAEVDFSKTISGPLGRRTGSCQRNSTV